MWNRRIWIRSVFALFATVVGGAVVNAEEQQPQQPSQTPPVQQYRMKQLLGTKIHIQNDEAVGTVDDVVFDDNGTIEYLIVLNQGKLVSVPWEAAKFNFEKRTATVDITPTQFQQVPTYTTQQYPVFATPAYRTQTYQYYGLTPGQSRRLNRRL